MTEIKQGKRGRWAEKKTPEEVSKRMAAIAAAKWKKPEYSTPEYRKLQARRMLKGRGLA